MPIQCPHFNNKSCDFVNIEIGFPSPFTSDALCQSCQSAGLPDSDASTSLRTTFIASAIASLKKNVLLLTGPAFDTVMLRHLTPEERTAITSHPDFKWATTRDARWHGVSHTFSMAHSYARALKSKGFTGKRVELTIKNKRHVSCTGKNLDGTLVSTQCPSLRISRDNIHAWCGECGCGDKESVWINDTEYPKLDFPDLMCPRGRPGFSNEGHPQYSL